MRRREHILSFGGPLLVVAVVAMWFVGLSVGAALVIQPALGSGVRATGGDTPTTFTAALFAGGSSVSIVGAGGFEPHTETFRLFYFFTSLAGTAVTSLVLTYLMQVYTGLLRRNTVALEIDADSDRARCAQVRVGTCFRRARAARRSARLLLVTFAEEAMYRPAASRRAGQRGDGSAASPPPWRDCGAPPWK